METRRTAHVPSRTDSEPTAGFAVMADKALVEQGTA